MNEEHKARPTPLPVWILILSLCIPLMGIADRGLWTPDEPREAALVLSMSRTGNWLIPSLAGEPFVEKPPLYYIVGAGALRHLGPLLGPIPSLRLASALWGWGALAMTGLIARRLFGRVQSRWAVALLATLPGFVHVTHWLLPDNALLFFMTAALWCLVEAYFRGRLLFLPAAALFAGGAFWSKGFIGPLIILPGALALLISWGRQAGWRGIRTPGSLWLHGAALLLFLALVLGWILPLRLIGGPAAWHEWFWENHVGRFSGTAVQLGHRQPPWYYLPVLLLYLLPALSFVWIGFRDMLGAGWRRTLSPGAGFLLAWALGGLLLLSCTATKRDIYLVVVMPAFALIGADASQALLSRPLRVALWCWAGFLLAAWLGLMLAPLAGAGARSLTGSWSWAYGMTGALGVGGAFHLLQRSKPLPVRIMALTVMLYLGGIAVLFPALDRIKNYEPAFVAMAHQVASDPAAKVALWRPDETTRAGFYFYCDQFFPSISDIPELRQVLGHCHGQWNGILALPRKFPPPWEPLPPWRVRQEVMMGINRKLLWIEGRQPDNLHTNL